MKKRLILLATALGLGLTAAASQQVVGSYYWIDGETLTHGSDGRIDPVNAVASPTCTMTAKPKAGEKAVSWMRYTGTNPNLTSHFTEIEDANEPLVWTAEEKTTKAVTLGLVCDWICYNLKYAGGVSTNLVYTNEYTLAACTTEKTGYAFSGTWTNEVGSTFAVGETVTGETFAITNHDDTAEVNLYPRWTACQYTVTLDRQSGSGGTASLTATYDSALPAVTPPTRTGWTFNGYWTQPDGGGTQYYTAEGVGTGKWQETNVTTLYASWTQKFLVTWKDASTFGSTVLKTEYVSYGEDATEPDTPEHTGYTFDSWSNDGRDIRANKTITAKYTANQYRVWMDANDGSSSPARKSRLYTYDAEGYLPDNEYARTGYTFVGWGTNRTDKVAVYPDGAQVWNWRTGGEMDLYAVWQANAYTVQFEPGTGSGTMEDQDFVYDQAQTLTPNQFTCGELGFLGWDGSDGKQYADGQLVSNLTAEAEGVITLTARWAQTIHLAFDGNGATNMGAMAVQDFSGPDDEQYLSPNTFGKVGYTFVGWATNLADAALCKIAYADGAKVKLNAPAGSTVTLYATWSAITYRVAFAPGTGVCASEMSVLTKRYDEVFELPDVTGHFQAADPDLDVFDCWQDGLNGTSYTNRMTVSNLCVTAFATNTLVATWKREVGAWSEHMHCTTLRWGVREASQPNWVQNEGAQWGLTPGMSVSQDGAGSFTDKAWLTALVKTNGTLSFSCRWNKAAASSEPDAWLAVGLADDDTQFHDSKLYQSGQAQQTVQLTTAGEWTKVEVPITLAEEKTSVKIHLVNFIGAAGETIEVDQMVWTPEGAGGPEPQPGVDNPTVTGITIEDGQLVIRSTGDAKFGYQVRATESLVAPIAWTVVSESYQAGSGEGQTFTLPIDPSEPQKFYQVEVLKKK